jgi:hypothetical protein
MNGYGILSIASPPTNISKLGGRAVGQSKQSEGSGGLLSKDAVNQGCDCGQLLEWHMLI